MKQLWAPWRAEYLCSAVRPARAAAGGQQSCGRRRCLFCRLLKAKDDAANLILRRGQRAFVVMNRFPYSNGHLMVAPARHTADLENLTGEESAELFRLTQKSVAVLRRALRPQGFNLGANLGREAGAGVAGHLHVHVVPRWRGDANFMPLLCETKVISEHLTATYEKLRALF